MIEFKRNVQQVLPYDRKEYIESFDDDFDSSMKWYEVSFQLPNRTINIGSIKPSR